MEEEEDMQGRKGHKAEKKHQSAVPMTEANV
jgi:hypothetical protein